MPYLSLLDTAGIQAYIFRAPKLAEIAGASKSIEKLTVRPGLFSLAADDADVAMIMGAGGNAAFVAHHEGDIKRLYGSISRKLVDMGAGLGIVVTPPERFEEGCLARCYLKSLSVLDRCKLTQPRTLLEAYPGLIEDAASESSNAISTQRDAAPSLLEPSEHNKIPCGSDEAFDLLAVVSIDGLQMGKKVSTWISRALDYSDEQFKSELGAWSEAIKKRWSDAWKSSCAAVRGAFAGGAAGLDHPCLERRRLWLQTDGYTSWLPFRHIYQGGDDLSFVCDARLALPMVEVLIAALEGDSTAVLPEAFRKMTASAGIAFVDSHFPFSRGVRMAEEVRHSAKMRAVGIDADHPPSTLDWRLNRQGERDRPDPLFSGATLRPYPLHAGGADWNWMTGQVLPAMWSAFKDRRGKLKQLSGPAEEGDGGAAVARLLNVAWRQDGLSLAGLGPEMRETGFDAAGKTVLLDVAELYDIYFPLTGCKGIDDAQ